MVLDGEEVKADVQYKINNWMYNKVNIVFFLLLFSANISSLKKLIVQSYILVTEQTAHDARKAKCYCRKQSPSTRIVGI